MFRLDKANGYSLTTLATFGQADGERLIAELIADQAGNLYGTTYQGGPNNGGVVFKLDRANNYSRATLATFGTNEGYYLAGGLAADMAGNL